LRVLRLPATENGSHGQSAAFYAGIHAAQGQIVALMDADRQNDPGDLPQMVRMLHARHVDMVQGDRSANRLDSAPRRLASAAARQCRRWLIGDPIRDSGCSLRVMRRDVALRLPLNYRGMHRYIPALARILGFQIVEVSVRHRARVAGRAKYGFLNRALPGFIDLLVVRWMESRLVPIDAERVSPAGEHDVARAA
jgi:glycosyltransferase involved in cell wall biosynthesis